MQGFTFTIKKRERRRFRNTVIEKKKKDLERIRGMESQVRV